MRLPQELQVQSLCHQTCHSQSNLPRPGSLLTNPKRLNYMLQLSRASIIYLHLSCPLSRSTAPCCCLHLECPPPIFSPVTKLSNLARLLHDVSSAIALPHTKSLQHIHAHRHARTLKIKGVWLYIVCSLIISTVLHLSP